jgi:hypothetical protein
MGKEHEIPELRCLDLICKACNIRVGLFLLFVPDLTDPANYLSIFSGSTDHDVSMYSVDNDDDLSTGSLLSPLTDVI